MSSLTTLFIFYDDSFQLNDTFLLLAIIICTSCCLCIVLDFVLHKQSREIPTGLMVVRTIFDYIAVMVVLFTIKLQPQSITTNGTQCQLQGALFLFSLYMATMYYSLICWELSLTLKNPFRAPSSGSIPFHIMSILVCFFVVLAVAIENKFAFRSDFEICFLEQRTGLNILNLLLIYIPVFGICIGGIIATIWSVRRLKTGINYDTFESRMLAIKQQTAIITCFTINYILQGVNWMLLFTNSFAADKSPYILSVFCLIACVLDAITWIVRKHIKYLPKNKRELEHRRSLKHNNKQSSENSVYDHSDSENYEKQNRDTKAVKNISAALRREVITCIICGLSVAEPQLLQKENELITINEEEKHGEMTMDSLFRLGEYYPHHVDDNCAPNILEEYNVDPSGTNAEQGLFTNYAPKVFKYLREEVYHIEDKSYYKSIKPINDVSKIALELTANFSEGRSGAFLFFTQDKKYLIKTLSKSEAQLLLETLSRYVAYMTYNVKTYLLKYFGMHSIKLYGQSIYFVVTNNIFAVVDKDPDEKYDIKGSWIDRNTNHRIEDKKLMKDKDLKKPLLLEIDLAVAIYKQLQKDAEFLADLNIMDYSLLLGVYYTKVLMSTVYNDDHEDESSDSDDEEIKKDCVFTKGVLRAEVVEGAGEYCIGIIDMLQKWDTNKQMERFAKSYIRCKDKNGISCIPPKEYSRRFLDKMTEIGIGYDMMRA